MPGEFIMPGAGKMTKTKTGRDGGRKLASGAGRKPKSGGEAQKQTAVPRGSARRAGSSKQRKG